MRRAWKKSWLHASALAVLIPTGAFPRQARPSHRANELTLARLRPGRDTLAGARSKYGEKRWRGAPGEGNVWTWQDARGRRSLRLEADGHGVIQTLTLSEESGNDDCTGAVPNRVRGEYWKTGRGLALGDPRQKVIELYGPPNSTSPSVQGQRELELLFYAFDWAGSDVPQVMEVTCDRASGGVVEITLAFPSL